MVQALLAKIKPFQNGQNEVDFSSIISSMCNMAADLHSRKLTARNYQTGPLLQEWWGGGTTHNNTLKKIKAPEYPILYFRWRINGGINPWGNSKGRELILDNHLAGRTTTSFPGSYSPSGGAGERDPGNEVGRTIMLSNSSSGSLLAC